MKLIQANRAASELIAPFLENNEQIDKDKLLKSGYVVDINGKISGCFILEWMEDGVYWLKQLYITQEKALTLPLLVESILALAKELQAKKVFTNSHQPMVDILLEAWQFHPQTECTLMDKYHSVKGKWWAYHVS